MTMHKSLKGGSELKRARNVLNRYERLLALREKGLWKEEDSVLGLPKVRIFRVKKRPKVKEEKPVEAGVEGAEGAAVEAAGVGEGKKEPEKIKRERADKDEKAEDKKEKKKEKAKEK